MASLFEGNCNGKAIDVEIGNDRNGKPRVRWNMLVVGGPHDGKVANYSGKLDADNIKFTKLAMVAIGWQGKDVRTFVDDVARAAKTVPFTAEIATFKRDNGKESSWTSARSIGFSVAPLSQLDNATANEVNGWFAEVPDEGKKPDSDIPF